MRLIQRFFRRKKKIIPKEADYLVLIYLGGSFKHHRSLMFSKYKYSDRSGDYRVRHLGYRSSVIYTWVHERGVKTCKAVRI